MVVMNIDSVCCITSLSNSIEQWLAEAIRTYIDGLSASCLVVPEKLSMFSSKLHTIIRRNDVIISTLHLVFSTPV